MLGAMYMDRSSKIELTNMCLIYDDNRVLVQEKQGLKEKYKGSLVFPGGHVEHGEDYLNAVIREIREETGITLSSSEKCVPFFEINHYIKNYRNQGINRIAKMVYYYVFTDKPYTKEKIHLTTHEIESNFEIVNISLEDFESELKDVEKNNSQEINRIISKETLASLEKLREILNI